MKSKYFLDTSIFVESFNKKNKKKMNKAKALIKETLKSNKGIISYQVIQEFLIEARHKFKIPIHPKDCKLYISDFLYSLCEVFPSLDLYKNAIDIEDDTGITLDKSMKIAAAIKGDAKVLYSDQFEVSEVKGIKVINPFLEKN